MTPMKTKKTFGFVLAFMLCATMAKAQYQQVNDIPYTESTDAYAQQRCKLDVYYSKDLNLLSFHPLLWEKLSESKKEEIKEKEKSFLKTYYEKLGGL